jgi:hypothetical protein
MLDKLILVAAEADRSTFCASMMSRTSPISFEPCPSHNVLMSFGVLLINEIINKVSFELKKLMKCTSFDVEFNRSLCFRLMARYASHGKTSLFREDRSCVTSTVKKCNTCTAPAIRPPLLLPVIMDITATAEAGAGAGATRAVTITQGAAAIITIAGITATKIIFSSHHNCCD